MSGLKHGERLQSDHDEASSRQNQWQDEIMDVTALSKSATPSVMSNASVILAASCSSITKAPTDPSLRELWGHTFLIRDKSSARSHKNFHHPVGSCEAARLVVQTSTPGLQMTCGPEYPGYSGLLRFQVAHADIVCSSHGQRLYGPGR